MEKPAETNAMVAASKGSASSAWKCSRWRTEEKPDLSSTAMKSGSTQTESVSGAAKLSGTEGLSSFGGSAESVYDAAGTHADRVRHAATDRDEIVRLVNTMPERERDRVREDGTAAANRHRY